jgi:hypothetical protein
MADEAKTDADWDEVKLDYEMRGYPICKICDKHGISERALYKKIREEGWILRRPSRLSDNSSTAERLMLLARRELAGIEQNIVETVPAGDNSVLVKLQIVTKTLDRIFELEKKEHVSRRRKPKPRLIDDARCEALARRFEGLSRQIELERNSAPAHAR